MQQFPPDHPYGGHGGGYPYGPPPPPLPPPTRNRAPFIALFVAIGLVAVALLASAVIIVVRMNGDDDQSRLRRPIGIQPVTASATGPCATGAGVPAQDGTTCYQLAGGMTVTQVKDIQIKASENGTTWSLAISLEPADATEFATLTQRVSSEQPPRNQLALVVDGKVIAAPSVESAITGGEVQISGPYRSRSQIEELLRRLTGGSTGG